LGTESNPEGRDKTAPGVGRRVGAPNFPAVYYTTNIDAEVVAREVKKAGYRTIGLVAPFTMYHGYASKLEKELAGLTIVDATEFVDPIKADKSAEEVALIRDAARMQDDLVEQIRGYIKPGMKDYEVMAYSEYLGQIAGSESGYFLGSSATPGQPASFRFKPQHGRQIRDGDVFVWQAENNGPAATLSTSLAISSSARRRRNWSTASTLVFRRSSSRSICSSRAFPAPRPSRPITPISKARVSARSGGSIATARAMTSSSARCS